MNKKSQALKVQEAYQTSKWIAMKRFIGKEQSSQCHIGTAEVTEHFRVTWARSLDDFVKAEEETIFHLEPRIAD
jgi:hypothetical protein